MIANRGKTPAPVSRIKISSLAHASLVFAVVAHASVADASPPGPAQDKPAATEQLFSLKIQPMNDAQLVGLPEGSPIEVLTPRQIYALALIEVRSGPKPPGGTRLAEVFDPKALEAEAARLEVGDFARFREDFFAGATGGAFRDPSGALFDLLHRIQSLENAWDHLAATENLMRLAHELLSGEASGVSQFEVDEVQNAVNLSRINLLNTRARCRDGLDEWKVGLGLSPRIAVVPGRAALAPFRRVFREADLWSIDPRRTYEELDSLAAKFPKLDDLTIAGRPLSSVNSDQQLISVLEADGGRVAVENRGGADVGGALELDVRRRVRDLIRLRMNYEIAKRRFVLANRLKEVAREQLISPPAAGPRRSAHPISQLVAAQDEIREAQDQLVGLWTSHQAGRLALLRKLGSLPEGDWEAFLKSFSPGDE